MNKVAKIFSYIAFVFAFCCMAIGYAAVQDTLLVDGIVSVDGYIFKYDFSAADTEGYTLSADGTLKIEEIYYAEGKNWRVMSIAENGFANTRELFTEKDYVVYVDLPISISKIGENAFAGLPNHIAYSFYKTIDGKDVEVDGNENYKVVDGVLYNNAATTLIHYPHNRIADNFVVPESVTTINANAFDSNPNLNAIIVTEKLDYMSGTTWGAADNTMLLDNRLGVAIKSVSSNYTVTLADDSLNSKGLTQTGANGTEHDNVDINSTFTLDSKAYSGGKWNVLEKSTGYAYMILDSQYVLHLYSGMDFVPTKEQSLPVVEGGNSYEGRTVTHIYRMPTHIPGANHLADDKYEIDSTYAKNNATQVIIETPLAPSETARWFNDFTACTSMDLSKLDTSHVTDMSEMFAGCKSLLSLDLTSFDTSKVKSIGAMFRNCTNLATLEWNSDSFDTSQVTNMGSLFYGCQKLQAVDVSKFNTSNVTAIDCMFYDCQSLKGLNVSNFDTSKAKDFVFTFGNCKNLASLDVSNFNTANATSMHSMFSGCSSLTELDLSNFDTANVTNMGYMFNGCSNVKELNLTNFDTANVTSMYAMFDGCSKLETLTWDTKKFNTAKVTTMSRMFFACSKLQAVNISSFNVQNVEAIDRMFYNCSSLTALDLSNFKISKATAYTHLFDGCSGLTSLDLSSFNTENVTDMRNMFAGCRGLTSLTLGTNFTTTNVTGMGSMFYGCSNLTTLDVSEFNTANVTDMNAMFQNCSQLTVIDVSNFDTSKVTTMMNMFGGCSKLKSVVWNKSFGSPNLKSTQFMFYSCPSLEAVIWNDSIDTSNLTAMIGMFHGCEKLQALDLSGFTTSGVTDMQEMFRECAELKTLDISSFDTRNVTNMSHMFYGCGKLTVLNLSSFDTSAVTNMNNMFRDCILMKKIIASEHFKTDNVTNSFGMFTDCIMLNGGNDTAYSSQHTGKEYARIDAVGQLGYFTAHNVAIWTPDADGMMHHGTCSDCGATVYEMHNFANGACSCGQHKHTVDNWSNYTELLHRGTCSVNNCEVVVTGLHNFEDGVCTVCKHPCKHGSSAWSSLSDTEHQKICNYCGLILEKGNHKFNNSGQCENCRYQCTHAELGKYTQNADGTTHNGTCTVCTISVKKEHAYTDGTCVCGKEEEIPAA